MTLQNWAYWKHRRKQILGLLQIVGMTIILSLCVWEHASFWAPPLGVTLLSVLGHYVILGHYVGWIRVPPTWQNVLLLAMAVAAGIAWSKGLAAGMIATGWVVNLFILSRTANKRGSAIVPHRTFHK